VQNQIKLSTSPVAKGKRKAVDEDDEDDSKVKKEEGEEDTLHPEEEIIIGSVPKANLVGLKYAGGIRTCAFLSLFFFFLSLELNSVLPDTQ
jgi:hypothetical protein